ncbi:MAG: SOS response-associated peptidase [Geobacteraceae bacterium]
MCGRFTFAISPELLTEIFGITILADLPRRYNIAPTQQVLAVRTTDQGRQASFMRWGLIPSWAKDPAIGRRMINARCESVHEKPAFRHAIRYRRCIIPAGGFYEWQEEGGKKHPLYVRLKDDALMAFAGIWEHWKDPEGQIIETCAILTTTSNELIQPLHDRMPVILRPEAYDLWLDPATTNPEKLQPLYQPFPTDLMEMYPVSTLVNSPRNDFLDCVKPIQG